MRLWLPLTVGVGQMALATARDKTLLFCSAAGFSPGMYWRAAVAGVIGSSMEAVGVGHRFTAIPRERECFDPSFCWVDDRLSV